jgi:hypothetical protein
MIIEAIIIIALLVYLVYLFKFFHYCIHCGDKYWEERWRKEKKHGRGQ